jgi:hypothetical protein
MLILAFHLSRQMTTAVQQHFSCRLGSPFQRSIHSTGIQVCFIIVLSVGVRSAEKRMMGYGRLEQVLSKFGYAPALGLPPPVHETGYHEGRESTLVLDEYTP